MNFVEWLESNKSFTPKSAHDALSRIKRVVELSGTEDISTDLLPALEVNPDFKCLSVSVKSQLRRSIRLYTEYKGCK